MARTSLGNYSLSYFQIQNLITSYLIRFGAAVKSRLSVWKPTWRIRKNHRELGTAYKPVAKIPLIRTFLCSLAGKKRCFICWFARTNSESTTPVTWQPQFWFSSLSRKIRLMLLRYNPDKCPQYVSYPSEILMDRQENQFSPHFRRFERFKVVGIGDDFQCTFNPFQIEKMSFTKTKTVNGTWQIDYNYYHLVAKSFTSSTLSMTSPYL